ncbi:hypothetical protein [Rubripirellula reticaptiva]|nr:hypothetical protein [Rubripirellula reticaptiva]
MRNIGTLIALVFATSCASVSADLVTLDFTGQGGPGGNVSVIGSTYMEDGFTLSGSSGNFESQQFGSPRYQVSESLFLAVLDGTITLKESDNSLFTLTKITLASFASGITGGLNPDPAEAQTIVFTGIKGASTVSQSYTIAAGITAPSVLEFVGFDGVSQVSWSQGSTVPTAHQFDNIELDNLNVVAVPEVSSLALCAIPACLALFRTRSRKR